MNREPLTKEQLESLGFIVKEKKLKYSHKIQIIYHGHHSYYVDTFYDYPTFDQILESVINTAKHEGARQSQQQVINKLFD
jgi:hypothetical protein